MSSARDLSHRAEMPPMPSSARGHRPSTLTVWRWELRKLVSQKRTYLGLFLAAILPLIFVLVQNLHQHEGGRNENIFASHITQSGLATPVLMLLFMAAFMLPLIAALVAGDIVAAEDGNGTLKTILTRSVDRGQVFAAKVLAAMTYGAIAVFLSAAVATIAGVASWGFNDVVTFSGSVVSAPEGLLLVFAANACYLIPLLTVVAIGVLLSTATRNSAASVVGHGRLRDPALHRRPDPRHRRDQALPAHRTVSELAGPPAHPHRLDANRPLGLGLRAVRRAGAARGVPRVPAARCRGGRHRFCGEISRRMRCRRASSRRA